MDVIAALMSGILVALEPINLGLAIVGVIVGLFVGAMPGLGSVNGVAILLPFTFVIQGFTGGATSPMILLASIYYGAMYGGAISSITLGIPGASREHAGSSREETLLELPGVRWEMFLRHLLQGWQEVVKIV